MSETETSMANVMQAIRAGSGMDSGVMALRLETARLHAEMEFYLKGYELTIDLDKEGNPIEVPVKRSEPVVNDKGVHDIMGFMKAVVNPQVVQGNFPELRRYDHYLKEFNGDFASMVFRKEALWDLHPSDMHPLTNKMVKLVEMFASRPIKDKERQSYNNTIRMAESVVTDRKKGMLSGIFGKGGN